MTPSTVEDTYRGHANQHSVFALDTPVSPPAWPTHAALAAAARACANQLDEPRHALLDMLVRVSAEHGPVCTETHGPCRLSIAARAVAETLPFPLPPVAALRGERLNTESDFNRAATFLIDALVGSDWVDLNRLAVGVDDLLLSVRQRDSGCIAPAKQRARTAWRPSRRPFSRRGRRGPLGRQG